MPHVLDTPPGTREPGRQRPRGRANCDTAPVSDVTDTRRDPELDTMVDWAAAEGWNPGLHDADGSSPPIPTSSSASTSTASSGSRCRWRATTTPSCSWASTSPSRAARSRARRRALRGRTRAGEVTTLGLDGVVEQEPNYALRDGFVTAHHSVRYGGTVDLPAPTDAGIRTLGPADLDALVGRTCSPGVPGASSCVPRAMDHRARRNRVRDGRRRPCRWLRRGACLPRRPQDRPALLRRPRGRRAPPRGIARARRRRTGVPRRARRER